jgi:hypothetical protein
MCANLRSWGLASNAPAILVMLLITQSVGALIRQIRGTEGGDCPYIPTGPWPANTHLRAVHWCSSASCEIDWVIIYVFILRAWIPIWVFLYGRRSMNDVNLDVDSIVPAN